MGLTVENQVDTKQYFCLSKIDPEQMKAHGINLSIRQLKEIARKAPEYARVPTGDGSDPKRQTMTKIYKYEDFRGVKYVQS